MSYCHCTLYLAYHDPSTYHWNPWVLAVWAVAYLFMYWVWDTCNSQKNYFRAQERGVTVDRKTFPQLPWKYIENPQSIPTKTGDSILCSGWCKSLSPGAGYAADEGSWHGAQGALYM